MSSSLFFQSIFSNNDLFTDKNIDFVVMDILNREGIYAEDLIIKIAEVNQNALKKIADSFNLKVLSKKECSTLSKILITACLKNNQWEALEILIDGHKEFRQVLSRIELYEFRLKSDQIKMLMNCIGKSNDELFVSECAVNLFKIYGRNKDYENFIEGWISENSKEKKPWLDLLKLDNFGKVYDVAGFSPYIWIDSIEKIRKINSKDKASEVNKSIKNLIPYLFAKHFYEFLTNESLIGIDKSIPIINFIKNENIQIIGDENRIFAEQVVGFFVNFLQKKSLEESKIDDKVFKYIKSVYDIIVQMGAEKMLHGVLSEKNKKSEIESVLLKAINRETVDMSNKPTKRSL